MKIGRLRPGVETAQDARDGIWPHEMHHRVKQLRALLSAPDSGPMQRSVAIAMLTRFLPKRFGPLDEATRERLQKAEVEQLEAWSDRVLDAESIEEVFESV